MIQTLRRAIWDGKSVTGLDGSLKVGNRGAGCKLAVSTGQLSSTVIQNDTESVDSGPEEQSSARCELQEILAWLAMIEELI